MQSLVDGERSGMPDAWWESQGFNRGAPASSPDLSFGTPAKKPNSNDIISQLQGKATSATSLSGDFTKQGAELLGPAAEYLKAILSGDRQATLQATMPERRRVIDQYSAAKKAIAEFSPRSGGTAGAGSKLQAQESSDLAGIVPQARQNAVQAATGTGTALAGLGLSAETLASGDLSAILQALTQKEGNGVDWGQIGATVGQYAIYAAMFA